MSGRARHLALVLMLAASPAAAASLDDGRDDTARVLWVALAHTGDAQAAFRLGTLFEAGDGVVAADPAMAYCWYRRAAAGGLPAAAFNVAVMHDSGRGARHDAAEAASWYARAAMLGSPRAEFNLGQLYEAGDGVPRNPEIASRWYRLAASSGVAAAADRVAVARPVPTPAGPALPLPVSLDPPAEMAGAGLINVALTWAAVPQTVPVSYYVEVVPTDAERLRPVFSATTDISAVLARLAPGSYAGRVFSVSADASHYAVGGWTRFAVGTIDALPDCAAAR